MSDGTAKAFDVMSGIETLIEHNRWREALPSVEALAQRCYEMAGAKVISLQGTVSLLLAGDKRLQALNARFRNIDKPTNVLSFPSGPSGADAPAFLGDVTLGFETCVREAEEAALPLADHAAHLIVHGLLHLVEYDHQTDEDAAEMEALEIEILAAMGISDPYKAVVS